MSHNFLVEAFFFFGPAGIANMTPVFASKLPVLRDWNTPLDFGRSWRGKRLFGANKTWRGLLCGILAAILMAELLAVVFNYHLHPLILIGALQGAGALIGDALESAAKRQLNIPPGNSWFPFDQIDFIVVGLLFVYPVAHPSPLLMLGVLIDYFCLHLLASVLAYFFGLKKRPI